MLFNSAIAVLAALALAQSASCAPAATELTSKQVVTSIHTVTMVSFNLNTAVSAVNTKTTATQISTIATSVTTEFTTIISDVTSAVTMITGAKAFGEDDADLIVDALLTFVKIHQDLLATVLGKHTIFAQFALTAPIVAVLRTLEAGIDAFALALIALIPSKKNKAKAGFASLDVSVENCITTYSQICVPSVVWPTIKPVCVTL